MIRLLVPVLVLILTACDRVHLIDDEAARLRGEYAVETYVINDDTLFSAGGINKIGVTDFKVTVSRKNADSLSIGYSWINESKPNAFFIRQVLLSGKDGRHTMTMSSVAPFFYEGTISDGIYTERTSLAGLGFVLLPDKYPLKDSPEPGGGTVKIVARKQH